MRKATAGAFCAFYLCVGHAGAAELTGGSIDLGYSAFTDDTDVSRTALRGQAELGFNRHFGLQLDLGSYNFDAQDETGTNVSLHGTFHLNETTSFGAFYTRDDIGSGDADFFGVEAGFDFSNAVGAEVYFSTGDDNGVDGDVFGFDLAYNVNDQIALNAGFDRASFDLGADLTRLSVGVEYQTPGFANYYAEFGNVDANLMGLGGSESYIGLGVRLDFGADRGATFGQRGLLDILPGG